MYKYKNIDLTPNIMKELLVELLDGKQFQRQQAIDIVLNHHKNNGGILSSKDYISVFKKATKLLIENGLSNPAYGVWMLRYKQKEIEVVEEIKKEEIEADEILGIGSESVYLYYFDIYKKLALINNENYFPCKIGRTDFNALNRILNQSGTCFPESPRIALIMKCEDSRALESAIHSVLKVRSKWMSDAPGVEWFTTSPEEVKEIYNNILK